TRRSTISVVGFILRADAQPKKTRVTRMKSLALVILLTSAWAGCDYYREQTGYLVTRSEATTHRYEGLMCAPNLGPCDKDEIRYTLLHKGIKIVAYCQAWDHTNNCGQLQVGKAYK